MAHPQILQINLINELIAKMSSFMDHLKCPICFEIPESKVYQCKNGHTFCSQCSSRLKVCPQCRVILGFERIRNRTLEQILDSTKFGCPNKELGCERILGRAEISPHLLYCKFEPFYFCKLIGFESCPYNAASSLQNDHFSQALITHLKVSHPQINQTNLEPTSNPNWVHLNYKSLLSQASKLDKGQVSIWTPHLVQIKSHSSSSEHDGTLLLFLCQISALTRNAAWICLCMTTDTTLVNDQKLIDVKRTTSNERNSRAVIQYRIKGQNKNTSSKYVDDGREEMLTPKMTWNAPVLTFKDIDKELESYALRIPICVLNSFGNASGDLQISVKISCNERLLMSDKQMSYADIPELTTFITHATSGQPRPQCLSDGHPNGASSAEEDDQNQIVFADVYCNGCGQRPLIKIRYKCLQCIDYDLCKICMDRGDTHMHHVFARIHNPDHSQLFNWKHRSRMLKGRSSYI